MRSARGPTVAELATELELSTDGARESLHRLAANHVVVLRPATDDVWMAMPFSAIPTPFRVEAQSGGIGAIASWWGNCAWDALGIAAAVRGTQSPREYSPIRISATCPDCEASLTVRVEPRPGSPEPCVTAEPPHPVVHFSVPARHWWDDIGFT